MPRTDATAVRAVLGRNYDGSSDLAPFIAAAGAIVDGVAECATAQGLTLGDDRLALLETWLAAHCYAQMDPTYTAKSTGGASGSYTGQTGMYLEGTRYGQMAVTLDTSGCLASGASSGRAVTAGASWLGKRPSEQLTYDERY